MMKNFFVSIKSGISVLGFILIFSFCGSNNADLAIQEANKACEEMKLKIKLEKATDESQKKELQSEIAKIEIEANELKDKAFMSYKDNPEAEKLHRQKYMKAFIECDAMKPEMKKMMQDALETMEKANK